MLNKEQIEDNYKQFKELLLNTGRPGVENLVDYLDTTDFKIAPASTRFHGNYEGGLCYHSLCVYNMLTSLNEVMNMNYTEESIAIVALLHDISKINTYELTYQNKKVYSDSGSRTDEGGRFDWETVKVYKTKDEESRLIFGNHEEDSCFIVQQFIDDLSIEEQSAIMHHHGGMGYGAIDLDAIGPIYNRHKLALLLHSADLLASYTYA